LADSAHIAGGGEQVELSRHAVAEIAAGGVPPSPAERKRKQPKRQPATGWRAIVGDYVALTKPRIISLLLLTTLAAMFLAAREPISPWLVIWTLLGGTLAAGGANAINMFLDRDVDALMGRTSRRPVPSSRITPIRALVFGLALNVAAFVVLLSAANLLAAVLALLGSIYYVLVYTRMLKRTTPMNIVLGGGAGAMPPLVGWAAVTGDISLVAICLFAIIFYWTPPHFWALALLRRADYARAGIPMLPVARGETETKRQILLYSVLMIAVSVLPPSVRLMGPLYLVLALVLGGRFLQYAIRLFRESDTASAWGLYKYSLLYLALLFGAMVLDHLVMLALRA
jgi:protoheme IX farnesyltransferase